MGKPREFIVYMKKPEFSYYKAFPEVKPYEEEIALNRLYENPDNQDKILVLRNRQPQWMESIKGYMLNFHGRVGEASVKNFILEVEGESDEVVLFGKRDEKRFNLDVAGPASPYLAFAIALSSFDTRFMCE